MLRACCTDLDFDAAAGAAEEDAAALASVSTSLGVLSLLFFPDPCGPVLDRLVDMVIGWEAGSGVCTRRKSGWKDWQRQSKGSARAPGTTSRSTIYA